MNRPRIFQSFLMAFLLGLPATALAQDQNPVDSGNAATPAPNKVEVKGELQVNINKDASADSSGKSFAERPDQPDQSPVDKALMKALEEEFENNRRAGPQPRPSRRRPLREEDVIIVDEEDPEEEWTTVKITVSYWLAGIADDTELRSRIQDVRNTFELDKDVADFDEDDDNGGTFVYELEIGLHRVISLTAMYYNLELETTQVLRNKNFLFKDRGFVAGDTIKTRVEVTAIEGALAIHAVKLSWLKFDVFFGARYMKTEVEFARSGDSSRSRERFELVTPMVGIGLTIRPVSCLEIYGTLKVGALEYDGGSSDSDRPRSSQTIDDRYLSFASLDTGIRINFTKGFGVGLGIRVESFEQERFLGNRGENAIESAVGGPYASIFLGF